MSNRINQKIRQVWEILYLTGEKFLQVEGLLWAGSFAFNAFFSLFPVIILTVTVASFFVDRTWAATEIIGYVERYVPISGAMQRSIFDTISGVITARGKASLAAFLLLVWVAIQCFTTLICVTNRAWGATPYSWWRLPVKSMAIFAVMAVVSLLGIGIPVLATTAKEWLSPVHEFQSWVYALGGFFIPLLAIFFSLILLYRFAPRRITSFAEVWTGALCATVLLRVSASLFVIYLKHFATLNVVYGAFGGIMALLLWIYLSGCIFIFGVCICVAQAETPGKNLLTERNTK